jgi:succinate dehydrogenase / fumarate reductase cytochrome b subunit
MSQESKPVSRPLSPHLGIYRWQITMTLSILHRATGMALVAGTLLLVSWLCTAAYAPRFYPELSEFILSPVGQLLLLGWMLSFYFHFANGIRHLFWDIGKGFALPAATRSGWLVVIFAIAMTAFTWGIMHTDLSRIGEL